MKQIIKAAILTGAVMIGIMPNSLANNSLTNFSDISEDSLYAKAINTLVEKKILNGYPDNTFRAAEKMTRAEFTKIMVMAEELIDLPEDTSNFTDIINHWAKEYIEIAFSNGIIEGYEDNTFKPEKEITYGEVATILLRNLNLENRLNQELEWPQNYMSLAEEIGLLNGIATNDLVAINPARRDNVALMLWNQINYFEMNHSGDSNTESDEENSNNETNDIINSETNYEHETSSDDKINVREKQMGVVIKTTLRRGEKYITVRDIEGNEEEIQLYESSTEPKLQSFIVYTLSSNGKMKLRKQLLVDDIDDVSMYIENVDKELITISGEEKLLDLELDEFVYAGEEIKLNKYTYYLVETTENEKQELEFDTFEEVEKEDIKLKEEDRLCFDEDTKIALIVRGLGKKTL